MALPAGFSPEQFLAQLPPELRLMVLQRLGQGGAAPQPMLPNEGGQVPPEGGEQPVTDTSAPAPIARGPRPPSFEGDMIDPRTGQRWATNIGPTDRRRLLEQFAQRGGQGAAPPPAGRAPDAGAAGMASLSPPQGAAGRGGMGAAYGGERGGMPQQAGNQVMSGPAKVGPQGNQVMSGPAPVASQGPSLQHFQEWLWRKQGGQ